MTHSNDSLNPISLAVKNLELAIEEAEVSVGKTDKFVLFDNTLMRVREALSLIRQHQAAQGDVVSALKRLVDLKEHKDAHGKNNWYAKNQKDAWDQAKEAIAAMNMGEPPTTSGAVAYGAKTVSAVSPANPYEKVREWRKEDQQREISDVMLNMKSMIAAEEACENAYGETSHQLMKALHAGIVAYLRATVPVMVSLKQCVEALRLYSYPRGNKQALCIDIIEFLKGKGVEVKYVA